jgi:two-component system, cell cycle sensor histidine kinase and response regulator CckA
MNSTHEILVIGNGPTQAEYYKEILAGNNFQVEVVYTNDEALAKLQNSPPSVLITEDGMEGYNLCQLVKNTQRLVGLPIILLLQQNNTENILKGLEVGATNIVPISQIETLLLERLNYTLANAILKRNEQSNPGFEIFIEGRGYCVNCDQTQIIDLLITSYERQIPESAKQEKVIQDLSGARATLQKLNWLSVTGNLAPQALKTLNENILILVAEDSPTQAETLKFDLEEIGFQVTIAQNGALALASAETNRPDILISDVMMPEMDGFELCYSIKNHQDPQLRSLPVILLTSLNGPDEILRGIQAGAEFFLTKPVNLEQLQNKIKNLLATPDALFNNADEGLVEVEIDGRKQAVSANRQQVVNLLFATYDNTVQQNRDLIEAKKQLEELNDRLEVLIQQRTEQLLDQIEKYKQAESEIHRQSVALESAANGVMITDIDANIIWVNKSFTKLTGYDFDEVEGQHPDFLESKSNDPNLYKDLWDTILSGRVWSGELVVSDKSHEKQILLDCTVTPVRNEQGSISHFIAVWTDITEKKALANQLLRNQRLESVGALASGIAHDLNNILSPILMGLPLLESSQHVSDRLSIVKMMETSAKRGADIVKQVLTFARGVEGERSALQPKHFVNEIVRIIQVTFPKNIKVSVHLPKDLWPILGDATQIHQILLNLTVNARDAMPSGGELTLEVENIELDDHCSQLNLLAKPGPHICLRIKDTGEGIPKEIQDRIFEPFFTTKEIGRGSGLGLSTVIGIVKSHKGFLNLQSSSGKGSCFEIYLPAVPDREVDKTIDDSSTFRADGELILVVDDEPSILSTVKVTLKSRGYKVLLAGDGVEALRLLDQNEEKVKAVITDMMMPGMEGPELINKIIARHPDMPIIGMSGIGRQNDVNNLDSLSLKVFLSKPFTGHQLLETLKQALA